jgi:hypothetical protein
LKIVVLSMNFFTSSAFMASNFCCAASNLVYFTIGSNVCGIMVYNSFYAFVNFGVTCFISCWILFISLFLVFGCALWTCLTLFNFCFLMCRNFYDADCFCFRMNFYNIGSLGCVTGLLIVGWTTCDCCFTWMTGLLLTLWIVDGLIYYVSWNICI